MLHYCSLTNYNTYPLPHARGHNMLYDTLPLTHARPLLTIFDTSPLMRALNHIRAPPQFGNYLTRARTN